MKKTSKRLKRVGTNYYPRVSTILSELSKPQLLPWAAKCTANHLKANAEGFFITEKEMKEAKREYKRIAAEARDIGGTVHAMIAAYWQAKIVPVTIGEIGRALKGFKSWVKEVKPEALYWEQDIYSKRYGFAGRVDFIGKAYDELCVVDFKTGPREYRETKFQVAAYAAAWKEMNGLKHWLPAMSVVLYKDKVGWEVHQYSKTSVMRNYKAFKHLLRFWHITNVIK